MIWIYISIILLAAFPLVLTIVRMRRAAHIRKNGISTTAMVRDIKTFRSSKSSMDLLVMEYREVATGRLYHAQATVTIGKHRIGDNLPVFYLPDNPSKYAVGGKSGYWIILIFCILLFLFVIFAIYKINEMVTAGSL